MRLGAVKTFNFASFTVDVQFSSILQHDGFTASVENSGTYSNLCCLGNFSQEIGKCETLDSQLYHENSKSQIKPVLQQ